MTSSLIPERPLLISPTLAATIGLEEAVMLHVISELKLQVQGSYRNQRRWSEIAFTQLEKALPFWQVTDIKRVQRNLQEKGLILVEPTEHDTDSFLYAINQAEQAPQTPKTPTSKKDIFQSADSGKASYIPPNWYPSQDLFIQCCQQHNIPRDFVEQRVRSFVMDEQERRRARYSWHNAFRNFIIQEWRNAQSYQGAKELETVMSAEWAPSEDAMSILEHAGINHCFIEDCVPEFVLFWRERGLVTSTWNTKFIAHVRRQWSKFDNDVQNDTIPRPIDSEFSPSTACLEVLEMANIDVNFALDQVREFVLYWRDRGEACPSWNTKFLQHVKFRWAHRDQTDITGSRPLEVSIERFTDRSWAK